MEFENARVLVTGGTGFLGHHVSKALLDRKADVTLLVQPHEKTWRLKSIGENVYCAEANLMNREETRKVIQDVRPEVIIHFAGLMERRRDLSILDDLVEKHLACTMNLILGIDREVTKLVINTGSGEEYGEQADPFVETLSTDPVSPYSASKACATAMATYCSRALGIPIVTMRPFLAYGPAQLHDTLIPFLIKGVLQKKTVELTDGLQYRDFLYVDDLVSCYLAVIEKVETFIGPEIFNVGSGQKTRVRDVVEIIADLLDGRDYLNIGARPMRDGEVFSMIADIKKSKKLLGWRPKVSLRTGLRKTIDWWLEHEKFWKE